MLFSQYCERVFIVFNYSPQLLSMLNIERSPSNSFSWLVDKY
ncbi:MAG: hypothetical protein OFPI_15110 [Osedax symbiont Rs2]|nr:MAG: hypothetical protein OFPI_15110 [Osedax symbiont Rs2]